MKNNLTISYILPTYQAETFIYNNLKAFSKYCLESGYNSEIIVVNDGSTDRTNETIERYLREQDGDMVKYINMLQNMGKGTAIKNGIEESKGQYIVFTDCDLQYSFKNIKDVVDALLHNGTNIVIASRMHKDSIYTIKSSNLSWIYIRHTAGRIYNKLIKFFTGLNLDDTQAGLKGFDRDTAGLIFRKMTISGFGFDVDILACAKENNKKISTIPVEFNYEHEMSTINFVRQIFIMSIDVLRVFLKRVSGYYRR